MRKKKKIVALNLNPKIVMTKMRTMMMRMKKMRILVGKIPKGKKRKRI